MLFCHDPANFELSPRFLSKLVEGGTGVGLLQRAQADVTRRAFQFWRETGRSDENANWVDAERSLVHWRSLADFEVENNTDDSPKGQKLETVALEDVDFDFAHLSRRDLIDLCAAMQHNLRTTKSAFSEERSAVKALRKELQHERARLQRFSCKLIATESELYRRKSESTQERQVPSMPLDTVKPSEGMEHFKLTPRVRRRRIVSHPQRTYSSDCEAYEINNECTTQCDSPTGAWWFSDSEEDHHVIDSEFQDFQVGKFDCSDRSLDDTICPQGDSNMNLPKSYGPLYDCYDPDTKDKGDSNLENTDDWSSDEDFDFSLPKVWR